MLPWQPSIFRVHTQKVKYFSRTYPYPGVFQNKFYFSQDKCYACIYTQVVETRTIIVLYAYNSCCISKFLRKKLGKACWTEQVTWESVYFFFANRGMFKRFYFSRTFFHFQVLSRPGNWHCKNQVHSRISRTRKSLDLAWELIISNHQNVKAVLKIKTENFLQYVLPKIYPTLDPWW